MKRLLFGVIWLAGFLLTGFIAAEQFKPLLVVRLHNPFWAIWPYAGLLGIFPAIVLFIIAASLGLLPGVRRPRTGTGTVTKTIKFGPWQAVWLVAGFLLMQLAGLIGLLLILNLVRFLVIATSHTPPAFNPSGVGAGIAGTLTGSFTAALWSVWYIRRRGEARLHDGSPSGIAWRRASGKAYLTATFIAVLIILVVMVLFHFIPPDVSKLEDLPDSKLFDTPGWPAVALLALVVFIAPPLEEFVFRGGVFAALATRLSPLWAGIITTLVFVAVHAPEKIYYPAGFIDVGLMAAASAWMRVKFGSIRPGILLHVLYNAGLMVAVTLSG
jgi:membrane protease YdiL (CAAX protease family)